MNEPCSPDSTAQYIQGDVGTEVGGLVSEGLQCVAVLVGVYSKTSGLPIIGVINQPFATRDDAGKYVKDCFVYFVFISKQET